MEFYNFKVFKATCLVRSMRSVKSDIYDVLRLVRLNVYFQ